MTDIQTESDFPNLVKNELQAVFPTDIYQSWLASIESVWEEDNTLFIEVPTSFSVIWITDNYLDLIKKTVVNLFNKPLSVKLIVSPSQDDRIMGSSLETSMTCASSQNERSLSKSDTRGVTSLLQKNPQDSNKTRSIYSLNEKYTFQNFIVGPGNQMAHAASMAVAANPAKAYNPLFIYGDTGLGKTHLMHAVAHEALNKNPKAKIAYISSEKFLNHFIEAIQQNALTKFRKKYRSLDILLIDDIHFLAGKERIQEEFFHTFNDLFESQKQIILTSDRPVNEISKLESRLVSRFQCGLPVDIQAPDFETRYAIIGKKANELNLELEGEVLEFIANSISTNIRTIEGAINRLANYHTLSQAEITIAIAEKLLHDLLKEAILHQVSVDKIQKKVAETFSLRVSELTGKKRPAKIAFPRQIAMYLSRSLTNLSQQEIGSEFGGRDHGTVIHACKAVVNRMETDASVKRKVEYLIKQLSP